MSYFLNGGLGVKFYLREGDYVLRSQPISSPPRTPPLAHICRQPFFISPLQTAPGEKIEREIHP